MGEMGACKGLAATASASRYSERVGAATRGPVRSRSRTPAASDAPKAVRVSMSVMTNAKFRPTTRFVVVTDFVP